MVIQAKNCALCFKHPCSLFDDVVPNSDYTGLNDWLAAKSNLKNCAAEGRSVKIEDTVPEFA